MATYDKVAIDQIFPYGEENAVASFYKWVKDLFGDAYEIHQDKDGVEFSIRTLTKFPCIVVLPRCKNSHHLWNSRQSKKHLGWCP